MICIGDLLTMALLSLSWTPYVKYNMFHKEMKRKFRKNPFHQANMFYNEEQDFYVCPMGQHMEHITNKKTVSDLGYISNTSVYRAANYSKCPLRGMVVSVIGT